MVAGPSSRGRLRAVGGTILAIAVLLGVVSLIGVALAGTWSRLEPLANLRWWFAWGLAIPALGLGFGAKTRWMRVLGWLALLGALWGLWPGLRLYGSAPNFEPRAGAELGTEPGTKLGPALRVGSVNLLFGIAHPRPVRARTASLPTTGSASTPWTSTTGLSSSRSTGTLCARK